MCKVKLLSGKELRRCQMDLRSLSNPLWEMLYDIARIGFVAAGRLVGGCVVIWALLKMTGRFSR